MLADEIVLTPLPEDLREERLRLGCALRVAHRQQCVSRGLECILLARRVVGPVERDGKPKQKVGALGVIRPERERVVVLRRRDRVAVEARTLGRRPRARPGECAPRSRRRYHLTHGRARAPSSSGTRASRRGPQDGRGRRSTPRRRGASARDRHVGSGRTRRRERARARTRTRSPLRVTSGAGGGRNPCARVSGATWSPHPGPVRSSSPRTPCRQRPRPAAGSSPSRAARRGGRR